MNENEQPFIEAHTQGDGDVHDCAPCGGTVSESQSMVFVDGEPMHVGCWEN